MPREELAVLVVDDDDAVRRIIAEFVTSRGYQVVEASNGDEAWDQLLSEPIDVVVSDLQMPQCDGHELCRRIRHEPSLQGVRVVIITGCLDVPDPHELDCDSVLTKPVSVPMLLREIERVRALTAGAA